MSLMIGVSGIRGIIGQTMTPQLATSAGCAMATFVKGGRVVVARDSRPSGSMVQAGVVSGLMAGGCEVIEDLPFLYDVPVTVDLPEQVKKAMLIPANVELEMTKEKGTVNVTVPQFQCHTCIVFEY